VPEDVKPDGEVQFVGVEIIQEPRRVDVVESQVNTRRDLAQASPNLKVRSAVAGSNASSRDTSVWIWESAVRTGSTNVTARGVRRRPSGPRVRSSSLNSSRRRARLWLIDD